MVWIDTVDLPVPPFSLATTMTWAERRSGFWGSVDMDPEWVGAPALAQVTANRRTSTGAS